MLENENKLQIKKQELLSEYKYLQKEQRSYETIINCQVKREEISERQKEIEEELLEINCELLKSEPNE